MVPPIENIEEAKEALQGMVDVANMHVQGLPTRAAS